jgi:hypothetical protein
MNEYVKSSRIKPTEIEHTYAYSILRTDLYVPNIRYSAGADVSFQRQQSCNTLCNNVMNEYVEMLPE